MGYCELSRQEQTRRREIVERTRRMILAELPVKEQEGLSLMAEYRDYYLQISFSELHPLMVLCLARAFDGRGTQERCRLANELNLHSILGSHAINDSVGCYSYRATQWLDTEMEAVRFYEILERCADEAARGYWKLTA